MKKNLIISLFLVIMSLPVFAGGIVTNTNQSAAYVRMLARDATLGIDAVYFNPAGLTKLGPGLHLSINNQTIFQNRTIKTDYPYLNSGEYLGTVMAPVFPSLYAAFNVSRFSFSFGFNPVGGGGSAKFDTGLPSFEYNISDLVPALQASGQPVTAYKTDLYFEGKSVYWGAQAGVSYEINDMLSVFAGGRYVTVSNSYLGHIKDIEVNMGGTWMRADAVLNGFSAQYNTAAEGTEAMINAGAGSLTFAQAEALGIITPTQQAQFEGGLTALGYPATTDIATANTIYSGASTQYAAKATLLADQNADADQTGSGITPIIGANISLMNKMLNIGIKYEFRTKMEVAYHTKSDVLIGYTPTGDPITQFPDGEKNPNDMPAMLSLGAALNLPKVSLSAGYHQYFDKVARYDMHDANGNHVDNSSFMDKNNNEIALGIEYNINPVFLVSAGYLRTNTGVKESYQTDLSPEQASNSGAIGGAIKFSKLLTVNLGLLYTKYLDADKNFTHYVGGSSAAPVNVMETYIKDNIVVSVGVDINLSK